jgi:hypothetical protein
MKPLSTTSFVLRMLLVTICSTAVVIVWATNRQNNVGGLRLENKTRSLTVDSVQSSEVSQGRSLFAVTVRNGYDKPIAAYSVRVQDNSMDEDEISLVESAGLVDGWALAPNSTDTTRVYASSGGTVVLTIYAVMFEDGTGDGDANDLTRLQETRAGVKLAYQRIAPILRRAANRAGSPDEVTGSLGGEVASISDKEVPMNSRRGFAQAKTYIASELKDLKEKLRSDPALKQGEELNKKAKAIEKALARL